MAPEIALTREEIVVTVLEATPAEGANRVLAQPPQSLADPIDDVFETAATGVQTYVKGSPRVVLPTTNSRWVQRGEFLSDEQLRDIRSELPMIKGRLLPGTWNMTTYVKPYSDAVSPPTKPLLSEVHNLMVCSFGKVLKLKTGDALAAQADTATKYKYLLTNDLPSFSSWVRRGSKQVVAQRGCTVNQVIFNVSGGAIATMEWSGEFIEQIITGNSKFDATQAAIVVTTPNPPITETTVTIKVATGEGRRFEADSLVYVHKAGTSIFPTLPASADYEVMKVKSVDYTTDTLTCIRGWIPGVGAGTSSATTPIYDTTKAFLAGSVELAGVSAWFPTPVGEFEDVNSKPFRPIHGKFGQVTIDSAAHVVLTSRITLTNNVRYYIDEKNGVLTAETVGTPGRRQIAVALTRYIKADDTREWTDAVNQLQRALVIPCGSTTDTPKRIFTIKMPQVEFRSPDVAGGTEFEMTSEIMAVGTTTGNDEMYATMGDATT